MAKKHTLGELMWAVYVVTADNYDRQLETLLVGMNQHLCCSFAGSIRVCGGQDACLEKIVRIISNFSVNLISGNVDELLDANFLRTLQNHMCAVNVGVCERVRVTETQINVGLRCEMEDGVNFVSLEAVHHFGGICDIAMVESEVALVVQGTRVVEGSAVV